MRSAKTKRSSGVTAGFTLIEVGVALAIIMLATGLAVSAFRGESPSMKMERAGAEFSAFCATVRFRAAEDGIEWIVSYDPREKCFVASRAGKTSDGKSADDGEDEEEELLDGAVSEIRHSLPDGFEFSTPDLAEEDIDDDEMLEIFRFFADGAAAGGYRLIFRCGTLEKVFEVSRLTGRLMEIEPDEDGEISGVKR